MPYDSSLDESLFSKSFETESGRLTVSVYSYNKGQTKLQITRENRDGQGDFRFAKLGRITKEEAHELLAMFLLKNNGLVNVRPIEIAMMWAGGGAGGGMTLGGVTRDGKDAVNELSYLFLL